MITCGEEMVGDCVRIVSAAIGFDSAVVVIRKIRGLRLRSSSSIDPQMCSSHQPGGCDLAGASLPALSSSSHTNTHVLSQRQHSVQLVDKLGEAFLEREPILIDTAIETNLVDNLK